MFDNFFPSPIWQYQIFSNSVNSYATAFVAFLVLLFVFGLFQKIILARARKIAQQTKTDLDDALIRIIESIRPPFYSFLAFWIALRLLLVIEFAQKLIDAILIIWIIYRVVGAFQILIDYVAAKRIKEVDSRKGIEVLSKIAKGILWTLGILLILSNLGINITSLVAGLGIGGVAVALALQNILSDLFSSFAIYFDKPFMVGDFIIVGDEMGTVEKIGIKTTRIKSLQGEEIVISNQELTSARIHNYKKMQARRVAFAFGVTYDTPLVKLKKTPQIVEEIVRQTKLVRFDRAHFHKFGDSALLFEAVYYVENGDYSAYMDVNQEIHFKIKEAFEKEGISMAFPTQSIYLEKK